MLSLCFRSHEVASQGTYSFFSIYANIITARIILSWIPQAQGVAVLRSAPNH